MARTKRIWRRLRKRLRGSPALRGVLARALVGYLRLVHRTNPLAPGSVRPERVMTGEPVIIALWHERHFMVPFAAPESVPVTALISRSSDAELNAAVLEQLGVETVRGSGGGKDGGRGGAGKGSVGKGSVGKGGAGAFKALLGALRRGRTVVMIADPQGSPREAGAGIVRLARASGVPIVPVAYASSRVRVFERAWDRAALNLPFGQAAVTAGEPIAVPRDADDEALEEARKALTRGLNAATVRAAHLSGATHDARPFPRAARAPARLRHGGAA